MNNPILAVTILTLSHFDNDTIAAACLGVSGFGIIGNGNLSYGPMREVELIDENGKPMDDSLLEALTFEVDRRVKEGTFV